MILGERHNILVIKDPGFWKRGVYTCSRLFPVCYSSSLRGAGANDQCAWEDVRNISIHKYVCVCTELYFFENSEYF